MIFHMNITSNELNLYNFLFPLGVEILPIEFQLPAIMQPWEVRSAAVLCYRTVECK